MYRFIICFALFSVLRVHAQVEVSTSLPANIFLKYEGIPLRMEITNRSGEDIVLGTEETEDLLLIRVRDTDNRVIPRTKLPMLSEPWVIPHGETSVQTFDLVQLFFMGQAMSYRCLQDVNLAGDSYTGRPLLFEVVTGLQEEEIKRRKSDRIFTLISIHRNGHDELMLRVTNFQKSMVLATYYLERQLKFYDPFMKIDTEGEVATLQYISPSRVVMCRFKADGSPIGRTYYAASPGVPVRLFDKPDGGFVVQGAVEISENQSGETAP